MAKDNGAKCRKCRRVGERLFLKGERCQSQKCAIVKRNYPPGLHGPKGKPRLSDYGQQLMEKQKAKRQYGLLEKQFRLTFDKAKKKTGNAGDNFLALLELRLDNVIYRLGWATSRAQARQLVGHGHFTINDRKAGIPSMVLRVGDVIKVKANKMDSKYFKLLAEKKKAELPGWLGFDAASNSAKVLGRPDIAVIAPNFNIQMIIEYYSR